jgi:hypothetical protein
MRRVFTCWLGCARSWPARWIPRLKWVVYFLSNDLNVPKKPVADYASYDDARKTCDQLNSAGSDTTPYTYQVIERDGSAPPPDEPAPKKKTPADPPSRPNSPPSDPPSGPKGQMPKAPGKENPNSVLRPLLGSTFKGNETLGGYGDLTFIFHPKGRVTMIDTDGKVEGKWEESGQYVKKVTLRFYNGTVTYTGELMGHRLEGNATNGTNKWEWKLKR